MLQISISKNVDVSHYLKLINKLYLFRLNSESVSLEEKKNTCLKNSKKLYHKQNNNCLLDKTTIRIE